MVRVRTASSAGVGAQYHRQCQRTCPVQLCQLPRVAAVDLYPAARLARAPAPAAGAMRSRRTGMQRPGHRRRTATGPGSSGRPVLIETFVETKPPRLCDAAGLLDKMSGSTLGPRPGRCHRRRCRAARARSGRVPRTRAAMPLRLGDLLGDAGFSISVPTTVAHQSRTRTTERYIQTRLSGSCRFSFLMRG